MEAEAASLLAALVSRTIAAYRAAYRRPPPTRFNIATAASASGPRLDYSVTALFSATPSACRLGHLLLLSRAGDAIATVPPAPCVSYDAKSDWCGQCNFCIILGSCTGTCNQIVD
uniref:Uncharacterized protein n=2 Tax=Oryza TaxID=4527 RepID=Q2QPD9_ORYSJ|nr:hypothetical protein LOC_Os12g34810 [Oryza sativa Japonica Group]